MNEQNIEPSLHAINADHIGIRQLHILLREDASPESEINYEHYSIRTAQTQYDRESKSIGVRVTVEAGADEDAGFPFEIRVSLNGLFTVDESRFPVEHIESWAKNNAFFIMFPYLREHVYALTVRAGVKPMLLPLLEIPTYQIQRGHE